MYFVSFIIVSKRRKFKPQPWTQREKHNVSIYFEKYIHAGKAPGKDVCERSICFQTEAGKISKTV